MKVKVKNCYLTEEQASRLKWNSYKDFTQISTDEIYTVLGLAAYYNSGYGNAVVITICTKASDYTVIPLELFEIIDHRPSRYWLINTFGQKDGLRAITLEPEQFNKDNFIDKLTDGEPEVHKEYKKIVRLLESEFGPEE